jgi:hypothetical protein
MQIVCVREGRQGFHIGDIVHVSDATTTIDATYFAVADQTNDEAAKKAREIADLEEIAKLEKHLADAKAESPDKEQHR